MKRHHFYALLLLILPAEAYKFLIYEPIFGYSHTKFMGSIADALTEAGHDVTILMSVLDRDQEKLADATLTKKIIKVGPDPRTAEIIKQKGRKMSKLWTMQPTPSDWLRNIVPILTSQFAYQCEKLICDDKLMQELKSMKFDAGIAETFTICGLGIFEVLNLTTTIATFSRVHADYVRSVIGEPLSVSYVPGELAVESDRMTIYDRFRNAVDTHFSKMFLKQMYEKGIGVFRSKFGQHFKGYDDLLAQASYVLTNSNPYIDFPRPMLHKTVPIGGITVPMGGKGNALNETWNAVLSERKHNVLISFGTVSKAEFMPEKYKIGLLEVFRTMPDTTFLWKYDDAEINLADGLANVYLRSWLPQYDLLSDDRLTAFVTHAGLGSVTEAAYLGKPTIFIPVFSDQARNAKMMMRHGGGIMMNKLDLEYPNRLRENLRLIFSDSSYANNAKGLSDLLVNQPFTPKEIAVKYCEFAARFGRSTNLDPYGRKLSFIQYYLIDIILVICLVLSAFLFLVVKLLNILLSFRKEKLE